MGKRKLVSQVYDIRVDEAKSVVDNGFDEFLLVAFFFQAEDGIRDSDM